MKPVICFGEALIDFLNIAKYESEHSTCDNSRNSPTLWLNDYRQFPGGAPANAAVAVAKLGGNSYFSGQVGNDSFGDFLEQALTMYKVNTEFLHKHQSAKTALAFVTLDEQGERSFSFYRDNSADVLFTPEQVEALWLSPSIAKKESIFHFCSNTLTTKEISDTTLFYVEQAKANNALVSFDVNLRHNLWSSGKADTALVNTLVNKADVLKFSLEELDYLSGGLHDDYIQACLTQQPSLILITDGANDITYHTRYISGVISPPKVNVVDTTAGGDGFVGGLLFGLSQLHIQVLCQSEQSLLPLINFASACGAYAVSKQGAFPALPTLSQVQTFIKQLNTLEGNSQSTLPELNANNDSKSCVNNYWSGTAT